MTEDEQTSRGVFAIKVVAERIRNHRETRTYTLDQAEDELAKAMTYRRWSEDLVGEAMAAELKALCDVAARAHLNLAIHFAIESGVDLSDISVSLNAGCCDLYGTPHEVCRHAPERGGT